jgi:hypothetical protein
MGFSATQIFKHQIYYGGEQQSLNVFFVMMNSEIIEAASVY